MTTVEILKKAKAKIKNKKHWCKGAMAMNSMGNIVCRDDKSAVKWCAVGSLFSVESGKFASESFKYLDKASTKLFGCVPSYVNDVFSGGHKNVMKMYDLAIKMAKKDLKEDIKNIKKSIKNLKKNPVPRSTSSVYLKKGKK